MLTTTLRIAVAATLLIAFGCHHDTSRATATPADRPPLPPASGTPIGFLIDDATDLRLSDAQLATLHQIDDDLAARLEVIDASPRAHAPLAEAGGHMRGGGMGHHDGRGRHARATQDSDGPGPQGGRDTSKASAQHEAEVRDAIARAFTTLDSGQRDAARKLLEAHDIDVSGVTAGTTAAPATGSAAQPADDSDASTPDDAN